MLSETRAGLLLDRIPSDNTADKKENKKISVNATLVKISVKV
jgi:hypothetical protein